MIPINVFLTVLSPYTAFLPMLFIAFRVLQKRDILYKNPWNTGLLLLFIWSSFSGIVNKNPVSITASLGILLYFFVSIYFQNTYTNQRKIESLLKSIILFSAATVFIGVAEKISAIWYKSIWWAHIAGIPPQYAAKEGYRIYSTFGNPNVAGTWYAAMILVCIYFFNNTSMLKKALYAAATCLFIIALTLTGSRGAAMGLELGLAAYSLLKREKKGNVFLILIFVSVAVLMLIPHNWFPWNDQLANPIITGLKSPMSHAVSSSMNGRSTIWSDCLNMFKMKPVTGWGLLGIYYASSDIFRYHLREPHAHNIWITLTATLGVVGLVIYLYMKRYLFDKIRMLFISRCSLVPLLAGIQAMIIGHGLVDFTIMTPQAGILFFGCSALINALALQHQVSRIESYSIPQLLGKKRAAKLNL